MENGFTFLELIIVFFVAVVGIVGVFAFVQYPITQSRIAMDQLTATYLAQEGIEIIRNMRDSNWIEGKDWDFGEISQCGLAGGFYCEADFLAPRNPGFHIFTSIPNAQDPKFLRIRDDFYKYGGEGETRFTRKITVEDAGLYLEVKALVEWIDKGKNYQVAVQENLYNWWNY